MQSALQPQQLKRGTVLRFCELYTAKVTLQTKTQLAINGIKICLYCKLNPPAFERIFTPI